jgi:hypothetical protein
VLYVIFLATEAPGTPSMTTSEPETPSMTTEETAGNLDFDFLFADNDDKIARFRFILLFHQVAKSEKKLSFLSVLLYVLNFFENNRD